jgi:hypothetical protein
MSGNYAVHPALEKWSLPAPLNPVGPLFQGLSKIDEAGSSRQIRKIKRPYPGIGEKCILHIPTQKDF